MENIEQLISSLENNFVQMPIWKWIILALALLLFPFLRKSFEIALLKFKRNLPPFLKKNRLVNYFTPFNIEVPLAWILTFSVFILVIDIVEPNPQIKKYALLISQILLAIRMIQLVYICTDSFGLYLKETVFSSETDNQIQVLPFLVKTLKVMVVVLGFLITLQNLGFNVVSLLAGLGIGGIAIALAAQETVSNMFGSVTILIDKPFKIGDQIKILDIEGSIEEIGFRSTRIRSSNNTLFTIPNSIVAKEKIENLSDRKHRKSKHVLNITYETPIETIKHYIHSLEYFLKTVPSIDPDSVIVKFHNFASHSLDVLVSFDIKTNEYKLFMQNQEEILFEIYKLALEQKVDFAYPTQKILIDKGLS